MQLDFIEAFKQRQIVHTLLDIKDPDFEKGDFK